MVVFISHIFFNGVRLLVPQQQMKSTDELNRGEKAWGHWLSRRKKEGHREKMERTQIRFWGWPSFPLPSLCYSSLSHSPPPSLTPKADGISQRKNMDQFHACCFEIDDSYSCPVVMCLFPPILVDSSNYGCV